MPVEKGRLNRLRQTIIERATDHTLLNKPFRRTELAQTLHKTLTEG
ncbi:MAG: hypothetical protein AAF530_19510 [Pseudomonadota bacterium]